VDLPDASDARNRLALAGEIAAEIAHELRNVLQIISSSAYVARLELIKGDGPAAQSQVVKIEKNARAGHRIVDDLLALARGDALGTESVLVADLIAASRADLFSDAGGIDTGGFARATWNDAIEPDGLHVRAHGPLLARLLRVLYENAIQAAAPQKAVVTTRARSESGRLIVEIADDGPGVSEAVAGRVFDPLVTGREGGTGLGLALARRIVVAHGGSIALVASECAGATFRIDLPGDG
jgi:signal transduction histidine kinase